MNRILLLTLLFAAGFCSGCTPRGVAVPEETPSSPEEPPPPDYPARDKLLGVLKNGGAPLWFEFGPGGPGHIAGADDAALNPFEPWTGARHAAGLVPDGERLVMAVNRQGFLVLAPIEEGLALYRLDLSQDWDEFTVAALFRFRGAPAALLYRDDVFSAASGLSPPAYPVWALASGGFEPAPVEIPAFSGLSPKEGWDLKNFRQGRDGLWYYRAVRDGRERAVQYYRTGDPAFPGELINVGVFRNAQTPYNKSEAPHVLGLVLEQAALRCSPGELPVAAVVSPDFPGLRYFAADSRAGAVILELAGFYAALEGGGVGIALFPDGRLVYSNGGAPELYALPVLPEGFAYTRLAVIQAGGRDQVLTAAWEEQEGFSIGAAGFMVINAPWGGSK